MSEQNLKLNQVILPDSESGLSIISSAHVIIFIDARTDRLFAIDLESTGKPQILSYRRIVAALDMGELKKGVLSIPDHMTRSDSFIDEKELDIRDKKIEVIKPIMEDLEQFLMPRSYGHNIINKCLEVARTVGINASRTQIYSWIYRYLCAGCNANAFLRKPGSGKSTSKTVAKKTGPRRLNGTTGRMRNKNDEKNIREIVNKHIKCANPKSFPQAFNAYEDKYASTPIVDSFTGEITGYKRFPQEERLSKSQFINYARAYVEKNPDALRKAQGKTNKFNKDQKGLKGNIEEFYGMGPGDVYQVDETPLDIELTDVFDSTRQTRLGKPTCYSVIDMFSRAWAGLLLTFSKASAHTAREVIFVAFRNKSEFCKEIGVNLTEPWDIAGKCKRIFVDNAEFKAELARAFSRDAQIEVIFNREGNSQEKGLVERRHKSLSDFLYGHCPGTSKKDVEAFLKNRIRKNALLNINELYQILIDYIVRFNNYYPLENLPLTKKMRQDGVVNIPMSKFKWGLKNRPGFLKEVDDRELYLQLLEVGEVTVYRDHLFLPGNYIKRNNGDRNTRGLKYTCEWAQSSGIQDSLQGKKSRLTISCRFMRYSMSTIFIETPEGFMPARLHSTDALYNCMSDEEISYDKKLTKVKNEKLLNIYNEKQSETRANAQNIIASAKQEASRELPKLTTNNISDNRRSAISSEIETNKKLFAKITSNEASDDAIPATHHRSASENRESNEQIQPSTLELFNQLKEERKAQRKRRRGGN